MANTDCVTGASLAIDTRTSTLPLIFWSKPMYSTLPTGTPRKLTVACGCKPEMISLVDISYKSRCVLSRINQTANAASRADTTNTKAPAAKAWALFSISQFLLYGKGVNT